MAEPSVTFGSEDRGMTIVRVFDATRERIWAEWTEPERFADWYGGAASEVAASSVSMDVRAGGGWRATMFAGPERHEIGWEDGYVEVFEPSLLMLTVTDTPGGEKRDLLTVVLTDLGGGRTEMLFRQRGWMTPKQYEAAGQGWGTFFERMADRLTG